MYVCVGTDILWDAYMHNHKYIYMYVYPTITTWGLSENAGLTHGSWQFEELKWWFVDINRQDLG